ncbi:MAG: hypothetical protein P8Y64_11275 [Gammaproteobacteria bacterium]|jgi:hypothetical protein
MKILLTTLFLIGSILSGVAYGAQNDQALLNQLKSPSWHQFRTAAKIIYRQGMASQTVLDTMVERILEGQNQENKYWVEAYSWGCKAVASTGNQRYYQAVKEVGDNAATDKLKKYCSRAAEALGGPKGMQYRKGMMSLGN